MNHALWKAATKEERRAATEAADWLIDAVATATQDRRFLRGEPETDEVAIQAIMNNGVVACLRAIKRTKGGWNGTL